MPESNLAYIARPCLQRMDASRWGEKKVNVLFILFFIAAINLEKLKLFRHYYVLVSKTKIKQKTPKTVNQISKQTW